jgi:hypothetical protein
LRQSGSLCNSCSIVASAADGKDYGARQQPMKFLHLSDLRINNFQHWQQKESTFSAICAGHHLGVNLLRFRRFRDTIILSTLILVNITGTRKTERRNNGMMYLNRKEAQT